MIEVTEETKIFDGVDAHEFDMEYLIKHIDEPIRRQILEDYKKARRWDELQLENYVIRKVEENEQNQKLRELVEKKIKEPYPSMKTHWGDYVYKDSRDGELQELLDESKK